MIRVQYLAARDCVAVDGVPAPFPPGSLEARRFGDLLAVASPHQDTLICAWARFDLWTRPDGSVFASADDAYAYLAEAVGTRVTATVDVSSTAVVAAQAMPAGFPVAVSRGSGQIVPARADSKAASFVAGVLRADVAAGFAATPMRGAVAVPDWTAATGAPALLVGQPYFLGAAGGLTTAPDLTPGLCIARVGVALSPTALAVRPFDPVQL